MGQSRCRAVRTDARYDHLSLGLAAMEVSLEAATGGISARRSRARPRRSRSGVQHAPQPSRSRSCSTAAIPIRRSTSSRATTWNARGGRASPIASPTCWSGCRASRGWSTIRESRISRPCGCARRLLRLFGLPGAHGPGARRPGHGGRAPLRPGGALRPREDRRGAQGSGNATLAWPPPPGGADARGQGIHRDLSAERRSEGRRGAALSAPRRPSTASLCACLGFRLNQPQTDGPVSPLLRHWRAGRRFDARDPIEVCDQAREQGNKQPCLLAREAAQYLTITPE